MLAHQDLPACFFSRSPLLPSLRRPPGHLETAPCAPSTSYIHPSGVLLSLVNHFARWKSCQSFIDRFTRGLKVCDRINGLNQRYLIQFSALSWWTDWLHRSWTAVLQFNQFALGISNMFSIFKTCKYSWGLWKWCIKKHLTSSDGLCIHTVWSRNPSYPYAECTDFINLYLLPILTCVTFYCIAGTYNQRS